MARASRSRGRTAARRSTPKASTPGSAHDEFVITRVLDAPRDLVFEVWTRPEHLMKWFGPKGSTMLESKIDLRPSGVFHYGMRTPEGSDVWGKWVFREVDASGRLVFIASFSDEAGGMTRHPFAPEWPLQTLSTIEFAEHDDNTKLTVRGLAYAATESEPRAFDAGHESMKQGWTGTLDQLAAYLSSVRRGSAHDAAPADDEFVMTRVFAAPRARVFEAWTDPARLASWWGPHGFTNPVCEMDVRPGGAYRIVMRSPEGVEYPVKGVFREVAEPKRLVFTDVWDEHPAEWHELLKEQLGKGAGEPAREALTTLALEEHGRGTRLTIRTRFESAAVRDAMLKMGMTEGWGQSLDRLADLLSRRE